MKTSSTLIAGPAFALRSLLGSLLILLALAVNAFGQLPIPASTQFDISGFIQEATLDPACAADAHCGGTITVNGHIVVVPKETIVIFPANALTWQEIFAQAPAPYGFLTSPPSSGMALTDLPVPMSTYEAQVVGNRVIDGAGNDRYIAGLIYVSQHALNAGSGFINYIDYTVGEMRIGGILGDSTTGARVRINDPVGRFGRVNSPDIRFTVDPDNPTISAATGFPMCLPRVTADPAVAGNPDDPLCPRTQRPVDALGNPVPTIQTNDPVALPGVPPDATIQIPLEVGDWVSFAGTLVNDSATPTAGPFPGTANTYISAHTITNNVAVYTWPNTDPAYVLIDTTLIGTGGLTVLGAGEAAIRTRFEGMMTDVNQDPNLQRIVHLYGVDFSPLDGSTSDRDYGTIGVDPGPPNGAVKGRWRFRPPCLPFGSIATDFKSCVMNAPGTFLPPPREVRAVIEGAWVPGQVTTYANGIIAGQYHAPILEYIFPENIPGTPIVENNFNSIPFLAQGGYTSSAGTLVGQLNPWPSNIVPAPFCAAPTADAGGPYSAPSGGTILLTGVAGGTGPFTYAWTADAGTFDNAAAASPNYTAPQTAVGLTANLSLTVSNACGSATATTTVAVSAALAPVVDPIAAQAVDSGSGGSFAVTGSDPNVPAAVPLSWSVSQSGTIALLNLAISSTSSTSANVTYLAPSGISTPTDVTVTVTATNTGGVVSAPVSTIVTVNPAAACTAPTANAGGPYSVASGGSVTLNATATGSSPFTFAWTPPAQGLISPLDAAAPVYTAPVTPVPLDVTVTVTVSNGCGVPSSANATVHVAAALAPVVNPVAAISVPATTTNVSMQVTASDFNVPALTPLTFTVTQAPAGTLLFPTAGCAGVVQGNLCVTQINATSALVTFDTPATPTSVTLSFTAANTAGVTSAPVSTTVTITDNFTITAAEYRTSKQRLIVNVTDLTIDPTILIFLQPYPCEVDAAPCAPDAQGTWMYNPDPAAGGLGNLFSGGAGGLYVIDLVGAPKPACNHDGLTYATPCSIPAITAVSTAGGTATSVLTRIRL